MTVPTLRVGLLDGFSLDAADDAAVTDLPRGAQRLVAHLGLSGRLSRHVAAGRLWPEVSDAHAQNSLRSTLHRVQKAVPDLVETSGGALRLAAGVRVDVQELVRWADGVLDPAADVADAALPSDVALRGELLPGWYDDWVHLERERLRQMRMHAFEVLADKLACVGRYPEAVQAALAAIRVEPLRESAHRALVRVHLAQGNLAEAVREFEDFRRLMADELGVPPSPQRMELMRGIRVSRRARGGRPRAATRR